MAKKSTKVDLSAFREAALKNYRLNADVVTGVKILASNDSCAACQQISGKEFTLDDALELPFKDCTSEKGCRCSYLPIVMREVNKG